MIYALIPSLTNLRSWSFHGERFRSTLLDTEWKRPASLPDSLSRGMGNGKSATPIGPRLCSPHPLADSSRMGQEKIFVLVSS